MVWGTYGRCVGSKECRYRSGKKRANEIRTGFVDKAKNRGVLRFDDEGNVTRNDTFRINTWEDPFKDEEITWDDVENAPPFAIPKKPSMGGTSPNQGNKTKVDYGSMGLPDPGYPGGTK